MVLSIGVLQCSVTVLVVRDLSVEFLDGNLRMPILHTFHMPPSTSKNIFTTCSM